MTDLNLKKFAIFRALDDKQLSSVAALFRTKQYQPGETIIHEGDSGDEMFLLLKGRVEVAKALTMLVARGDVDTRDKSLVRLDADDAPIFGEMTVIRQDTERSATVKALDTCQVGIIKRKDLLKLFETDHQLGYLVLHNLAKILARRLEKANQDILKLTTAFSLALQD